MSKYLARSVLSYIAFPIPSMVSRNTLLSCRPCVHSLDTCISDPASTASLDSHFLPVLDTVLEKFQVDSSMPTYMSKRKPLSPTVLTALRADHARWYSVHLANRTCVAADWKSAAGKIPLPSPVRGRKEPGAHSTSIGTDGAYTACDTSHPPLEEDSHANQRYFAVHLQAWIRYVHMFHSLEIAC